ncbi:MAG: CoA ester lyase [Pseudomonadales bacterium]|nr:CoA ester lyase [Pseudomonadales bacterium]
MNTYRSRRTMLYVPAHIEKHIEKARLLPTDSIIFDLQESVPLSQKDIARDTLQQSLQNSDFGYSEKVIRVNPLVNGIGQKDIQAVAQLDVDAILFPRVESADSLREYIRLLDEAGGQDKHVMVNIESPLGVLRSEEIAACSDRIDAIVMGTTDLANELKLNHTIDRLGLIASLTLAILAARAHGICIIDGPHLDLKNVKACEFACRQARDLGFDGKTVIHPVQLTYNNEAFAPQEQDIALAKRILIALEEAEANNKSVAVVDDQLIEPSTQIWAKRVISIAQHIEKLSK